MEVALVIKLLKAKLDLAHRVDVSHASVLLLKVLVDEWRLTKVEHCRLGLDEVLNED